MRDDTEYAIYKAKRDREASVDFGLFSPHARSTDPATSHVAAEVNAVKRGSQVEMLLQAYVDYGPMTDEVAAEVTHIRGGWKRCSDLRRLGYIAPTGLTQKTSANVEAQVCAVTERGRSALSYDPQPARIGMGEV